MKTSITKPEHLQLVGLVALARHHTKHLEEISDAIKALLDEKEDDHGDISDVLYGDREIDWLLERREITVQESPK